MKLQENNSLKYRETLVEAKRAWDKNPSKRIFGAKSAIGESIVNRQKELAIFGGGVAILSKAEGRPILLYSPVVQKYFKIKEDADEYEYLHTPYNITFSNFIDLLFFVSREKPRPEYVSSIADIGKKNDFEYPFQYQLRKQYEILHCSTGEILFFCLLWRLIIELINKNNSLECKYSKELFSSTNYSSNLTGIFKTKKYDLIEKMITDKLEIAAKSPNNKLSKSVLTARDYFIGSLKREESPKYIFSDLGLLKQGAINEINKYTEFVFGKSFIKLNKTNAEEYAHETILAFAHKTKLKPDNYSLGELLNTLHSKSRFPILPYYFLMYFDDKKELKEHIAFPLWYTASLDTKYVYDKAKKESAVLHALYTVKPIWNNKEYKSDEWYTAKSKITESKINTGFESYLNDLYSFFTSMSKPIIDKEYYAEEANKNISIVKRQATKAAISQVMARNMSHNIGSHVLSRMITWKDILTITKNYTSSLNDKLDFDPDKRPEYYEKFIQPRIEYFNSYLKTRMDFLADIATSTPTIQSTKQFISELLKGFDDNRLLLNKISGITNFDFTIKVFKDEVELTDGEDFPVSISNDVLGFHAFYIILENIIRNTAKHSYSKNNHKKRIEFRIDVKDTDDKFDKSFYEITVSDGLKLTDNVQLQGDELREYKTILSKKATSIKRIDKLVFDQNTRLNKSILADETNLLRQGAWGLIEMDVSAAYLRKIAQEDVDDVKYQIPITEAEEKKFSKDKNKEQLRIIEAVNVNGCLGYKFHIPKPKELLIIDSNGATWNTLFAKNLNALNEWKNKGILFLKENGAENDKWTFNRKFSYPHELVLFLDAEKIIQSPLISKRQVTLSELNQCYIDYHNKDKKQEEQIIDCNVLKLSQEQLITEVWRTWTNKKLSDKKLTFKTSGKIIYGKFYPIYDDYGDYEVKLDPHGESYCGVTNGEYREVFPKSQFEHLRKKIEKVNPEHKELIEKLKFIDSTLTNVLVLDERIQELVLKERYYPENNTHVFEGFTFKELWDNANVYVPEKAEINLSEKNFSKKYIDSIHEIIGNKLIQGNRVKINSDGTETSKDKRTCKGLDFIVIHLGVIEKILKGQNNDNKDETEISTFISQFTEKYKGVTVIITSGRGKPENLPNDIPYLGYSIISQYLVENRFKSLFAQMLYSARPHSR